MILVQDKIAKDRLVSLAYSAEPSCVERASRALGTARSPSIAHCPWSPAVAVERTLHGTKFVDCALSMESSSGGVVSGIGAERGSSAFARQ